MKASSGPEAEARNSSPEEELFGVRELLAQAPGYMFTCDLDGRIRFINHVQPQLPLERVVGKPLYDWLNPEAAESCRRAFLEVRSTGKPYPFEVQSRFEVGSEWYAGQVGPISRDGQVVGFTVIVTDITQHKVTQQRLERSRRELERFAHVVSHDLQEPLRKLQTFGERLTKLASGALGPEGRECLERMQGTSALMRRLLDDLLTYSRVSSRARPFTRVDLSVVAREVLEELKTAVEQTGASVTLEALPVLEADATQMRQLLRHLMGNALKFRREGVTPLLRVHGKVDARGQWCVLVVEDNGIGFDEKYTDRLFQLFQRLHGRERYEGTGIGLAICRKIAEQHGGGIEVSSRAGEGSTFRVTLPLEQHIPR
ncbi:histidine kinase [Cystobacter fuscus DSM 2262]|uniref:histidine kinase n=1 Tax=Cystobacter fuscus (strain ATCC 25194 / DSM 2262 / NBRC 100088 / M29) TaxID=1242864 RepID=S9P298_CYSF2|nr:ATP-binding protein [Cystobacter fuscus]EPX57256.1 histidine kinase [Cystobacter fuscus DSM 2262]